MTREEAIESMEYSKAQAEIALSKGVSQYWKQEINWTIEAIDMAIEALKRERTDEWCTDCKEYDTEKKCCPRFNRVIRGAMNREPSEDEPQGDLISREAVKAKAVKFFWTRCDICEPCRHCTISRQTERGVDTYTQRNRPRLCMVGMFRVRAQDIQRNRKRPNRVSCLLRKVRCGNEIRVMITARRNLIT